MRCTSKKKVIGILGAVLSLSLFAGCGEKAAIENAYNLQDAVKSYGMDISAEESSSQSFFAEDLCVAGTEDLLSENVTAALSEAAGLFNLQERQMEFGKNVHERLFPASTTKILTAYVALKHGDLEKTATVTAEELQLEEGSSVCGLAAGDTISLEELLYGLIICSGNDAANVIADLVSGSSEDFVALMNDEAKALGATNSHFVNPHGLQDEEHYTTVYDMYLMFQAAIQDEKFVSLISATSHQGKVVNAAGESITKDWVSTNRYLTGESPQPKGIHVVGGKTGTTSAAGYCLVLYSEKGDSAPYISIVFKAENREDLYAEMSELLESI